MKIAFATPYDWAFPGGVNRHISTLAERLIAAGHDVRVIAAASRRNRRDPDYLTVIGESAFGLPATWITEAPRGMLYHRYDVAGDGTIEAAKIVPPTSQNLRHIEEDLRRFVPGVLDRSDDELTRLCEMVVRNYDPCISCATHFLRLEIERG